MAKLTDKQKQEAINREKKRMAVLEEKQKNAEEKRLYGATLAEIAEKKAQKDLKEQQKKDALLQKEQEEQEALEKKQEDEKTHQELEDEYNRLYRKFDVSTVVDIIDFDDYFQDIKILEKYPNQYGGITERERQEKEAQLEIETGDTSIPKERDFPKIKEEAIDEQLVTIKDYFFTHTPSYTKYVCSACGCPKSLSDFDEGWSLLYANRMDTNGIFHRPWCKDCEKKLFDYFYNIITKQNVVEAMKMFCVTTNTFWDFEILKKSIKQKEDLQSQDRDTHIIALYKKNMKSAEYAGKNFWNSFKDFVEDLKEDNNNSEDKIESPQKNMQNKTEEDLKLNGLPSGWKIADLKNKNKIIKMISYDPFEYIEDPTDRKQVQYDFLNILELGMDQDYTKLQAAIQIVSSYYRIRCLDKKMAKRTKENAENSELKQITDLKSKELTAITTFAKDNGFAERYSQAKAKGENTLSGVMNKMSDAQYEKDILNGYDIRTTESIKQVAETSIKAILEQLSLGEGDFYKICQEQMNELKRLREELQDTQEQLRQANIKAAKLKIRLRARENGEVLEEDENYD